MMVYGAPSAVYRKHRGMVDKQDGFIAIQRKLNRLEKYANKYYKTFKKLQSPGEESHRQKNLCRREPRGSR